MILNKNFLWLILNESYEENGNEYIPMVMEIYTEEMLVYKITSCSDGEIRGNWEISKVPSNILKLAEEEPEYDYDYWKIIGQKKYHTTFIQISILKKLLWIKSLMILKIFMLLTTNKMLSILLKIPSRNIDVRQRYIKIHFPI